MKTEITLMEDVIEEAGNRFFYHLTKIKNRKLSKEEQLRMNQLHMFREEEKFFQNLKRGLL